MTAATTTVAWADRVPQHMRSRPQWVAWGLDPASGRPKCPLIIGGAGRRASSTDPTTWRPFAAAAVHRAWCTDPQTGVGYVISPGDGIVYVDVDDCVDDAGQLVAWAEPLVAPLLGRTYVEVSPSGRGLHIFARARGPETGRAVRIEGGGVEVYTRGRYSTITGDVYGVAAEIADAQAEIDALLAAIAPPPVARVIPLRSRPRPTRARVDDADVALWALEQLDPDCPYDIWVRVGMAIHSRWPTEDGLDFWAAWSARGTKYRGRRDLEQHWRSFTPGKGIGLGTLVALGRRGTP